ncbi:testis-expressed protein 15 [Sphaerodactylus townsendi]|uniref:testis-expressed protein 15 n=1 Tax=Sphaerodactylus townsendi TaxID=933632 RepID=UPI002026BE6E|nr:testis-expressed protein 15 [Sphaerodactylus townsendi]
MPRMIEVETKMEPNIKLHTKQSFLPVHNRLKKFTIPKRTPDKDFLTDCSTNQRDYHEVKEQLTQGCFDRECNLESLWHFDKIEIVHNKDLEEEFVTKRTKMREQGRMDKELPSFLVASKEEVLKICQSGLRTSNSIKKQLHIMSELGNPQLGVYLFRHVDIALKYASKNSVPIENIIIFRVLLGKVKKINPPKGKKKVPLDPTPNYDCHVSRIHTSLKDSIEDQAIGSLVYFYEYSELSKPVDKPRQCLPHAVVKVSCINQRVKADYPVVSLKSRPKKFSGRGRGLLLENCTIVTRIGNSKLIYEHFHAPKNLAVSENLSVEVSESASNWNGFVAETQDSKMKHKLPGRWDLAQVEADAQNVQCTSDVARNRDGRSKNPNDTSVHYSTIVTSKYIKDPRLKKTEINLEEKNGEPISHGIVQLDNELEYKTEMKMSATSSIPWHDLEELFLLANSCNTISEEPYTSETPQKDLVSRQHRSPISSNNKYLVNNEHTIVNVNQLNREILDSQNTDREVAHSGRLTMNEIPEKTPGQIPLLSERTSISTDEKEENTSKKNEECMDNVKDWINTSHILDLENSPSDFNLNFQVKCSLTEPQLMKTERSKKELGDLPNPALLTTCTGLTTEDTAFMLASSTPAPLKYVKDTEIKRPLSENTINNSLSGNNSMPEIFEQELAVEFRNVNNPDVEVNSETDFFSEEYRQYSSVPQMLCSDFEVSSEDTDSEYQYLQQRMDWEGRFMKSRPDTEISGSTFLKENKNYCSCEEKTELGGKASKMLDIDVRPDLQISVANTLHPCHSSRKVKTKKRKFVTKCSGQKTGVKWSQKKKKENYIRGQKNSRLCHRKKALNTQCSSEMALLISEGQFETFEQSEKHIKNVLHALNTRSLLGKNKHLFRNINGATFHLQKAQRSVKKSLKILAMTGKKKRKNDSPLRVDTRQEVIATAVILPCAYDNVLPNKTYQKESGLSIEHSNNCENIASGTKRQVALDFIMQMSEILQKADETSCLNVLEEQVIVCKNILPLFIGAFEEKQGCSFEHVLVTRENAEKSMQATLKPCAIESLVELQIIMETIEFLENKRKYLKNKQTFRSLLWFDNSLSIELFGGQSGYQQQSNIYPAFQESLKYEAFNELQNHHQKLVDKFEITRLENKSYYCLLKLRREIKEIKSAVKSNYLLSAFFLSEPYICGANYGDTVEDLVNARKSIVDLINVCRSESGIPLGTEKLEHLGIMMDIISTKIEFIRTCEKGKINASFIGLEHIYFNAAVSCILRERSAFANGDFKNGEGQTLKIYEAALSKLYEIYEDKVEKFERNLNCASEEHILNKSIEKPCNCEEVQGEANYDIRNYLVSYPEICVGEILDEAESVNLEKLRQHLCKYTEYLEILKKCFQIVQEVDVDHVLITEENVLSFMESSSLRPVRLKPEAVEVYMDLAMVHETLCFIKNAIARKEDKPRFRSLLWCDYSLVNELLYCQQKMASFSCQKNNPLEITESSISILQDELNVVYDYAESLNCSYARQLLTRELEELLETRTYLQTSVSSISMCIDLVPYTIALNFGSNVSELEYNYRQFYSLFEKLLLPDRKDLGKMAHVMKILKTIEHMKFICAKLQKPPLPLVICQMLKNWRKSRLLKKHEDVKRHGNNSTHHKRPAGITSENSSCDHKEKNDPSDSKKKKVVASLMTTEKREEKESCKNVRKAARPVPLEREELQRRISTDNTSNKKDKCLKYRSSLSPSHSEGLKVADSLDYIEFSPKVSTLVNSNMLNNQKNQTDLKDFNNVQRDCLKENDQECFASCIKRGLTLRGTPVSPNKDPSPQNSPKVSFTSAAKLNEDISALPTLNQYRDVKLDVTGNVSCLIPMDCTAIPLELDRNGEMYGKKSEPNHALAYNSDSLEIPELNKFMELESLCSDSFSTENTHTSAECSDFNQNEHIEETPHVPNYSMHTYRTFCPSYSWYFSQTDSSYQCTQMYQEFSSNEMNQLTPAMLTATSMVYNMQSSTFYSQSYSHFGVGESQRFNFAQTYPVHSCFSSTMSFPYSYQQWSPWYTERPPTAQAAYPYSSNTGL